jgi:hypothetical protein
VAGILDLSRTGGPRAPDQARYLLDHQLYVGAVTFISQDLDVFQADQKHRSANHFRLLGLRLRHSSPMPLECSVGERSWESEPRKHRILEPSHRADRVANESKDKEADPMSEAIWTTHVGPERRLTICPR